MSEQSLTINLNKGDHLLVLLLIEDGRIVRSAKYAGTNPTEVQAAAFRDLWEVQLKGEVEAWEGAGLFSSSKPSAGDFESLVRWSLEEMLTGYTLKEEWVSQVTRVGDPPDRQVKARVAIIKHRFGTTDVVIPSGTDDKVKVFDEFCQMYWDEVDDSTSVDKYLENHTKQEGFDFYFERDDESVTFHDLEFRLPDE